MTISAVLRPLDRLTTPAACAAIRDLVTVIYRAGILREARLLSSAGGIAMKSLFLAFTLALAGPGAVFAGEIADQAAAAEKAVEAGDAASAVQAFDQAQDALWTALPLTLRKVEKAVEASGYGIYTPRPDGPYKPGEKIYLYMEPVGYGYRDDGLGNKVIELVVDMTLFDEAGKELGVYNDFAGISLSSRVKNRELLFGLTIDLGSPPVGKYRGDFTMRDKNSDKSAKFSVDFEFAN
jgi:hypothetical protein